MGQHLERILLGSVIIVLIALLYQYHHPLPSISNQFITLSCYGLMGLYLFNSVVVIRRMGWRFLQSSELFIKVVFIGAVLIVYTKPSLAASLIILEESVRLIVHLAGKTTAQKYLDTLRDRPALLIAGSFLSTIFAGTILLSLPISTVSNHISFIDALFTATSATCVTGLVVLDTGTFFTPFGQCIILLLIQIGGLGIMTLSTSLAVLIGKRMSIREKVFMQDLIASPTSDEINQIFRSIVIFTFTCEATGSILLAWRFLPDSPDFISALAKGVFHSVSAFCNAGFSLFPNSLMNYATDPITNITITSLILGGGLGFAVIHGIAAYLKSAPPRHLNLHTKMTLTVTCYLLFGGMLFILLTEYSRTLIHYSFGDKLLISWFQSVTLRTAGFQTIDLAASSNATIFMACVWMFIGASPGSTGGGIKTTTVGVLWATVKSILLNREQVEAFNRTIRWKTVRKSISIALISLLILVAGVTALCLVTTDSFQSVLFEAISAIGTVGLSLGITAELTVAGKIVITVLMFVGRIGPLTLAFMMGVGEASPRCSLPSEKVVVG